MRQVFLAVLLAAVAGCSSPAPPAATALAPPAAATSSAPAGPSPNAGEIAVAIAACSKLGEPGADRDTVRVELAGEFAVTADEADAAIDEGLQDLCPYLAD